MLISKRNHFSRLGGIVATALAAMICQPALAQSRPVVSGDAAHQSAVAACAPVIQQANATMAAYGQRTNATETYPEFFRVGDIAEVRAGIDRTQQFIRDMSPGGKWAGRRNDDALHVAGAQVRLCLLQQRLAQLGGSPEASGTALATPPTRTATAPAPSAAPSGIDWQARGAAPGYAPNPMLARDSRGWRSADHPDLLPLYGPSQADLDTLTPDQKSARRDGMTQYQVEKDNMAWRGHKLHFAANDMTQCMKVVPTGTRLEWGTSGKFKMINTCSDTVNVSWCANRAECDGDHGNLWTLRPGMEWPIFFADPADPYIRVGACRNMGKPVPPDAQLARQGGVSTRHNDPPVAPGVGIMPNHKC